MAEPIIEQIADWINDAIDGEQDPDTSLTLRAVRPTVIDWDVNNFRHGDVIIEIREMSTQSKTASDSRTELATWDLHGIIRDLPADTAADTMLCRMSATVRRLLLAGNSAGRACGSLALHIDCPAVAYGIIEGGVVAEITAAVTYDTEIKDGYAQ